MSWTLHRARSDDAGLEAHRPTMKMSLSVELPRERASVPLVRHLATQSLHQLGVVQDVVDDIEIALSEVCTNVIDHADVGESYEVELFVEGQDCRINVVDSGCGFNITAADRPPVTDLERGRGLAIVRAVMDQVALKSEADHGTLVTLGKHLDFQPGSEGL